MFGKSQNLEFQCLEKANFGIPVIGKSQNFEFKCVETLKCRCLEITKIYNSNVSKHLEFQCLEKGEI